MAGGAKETPRQRMINMMYLVLTALLALQVSNTVLEKFYFIDESLKHSIEVTRGNNHKTFEGIKEAVEKNGNRGPDVAVLKKAEQVVEMTNKMMSYMLEVRKALIDHTGGVNPEDGKLIGEKDYDAQMNFMLGVEGSKSGKAYEMEQKLNKYVDDLITMSDSLKGKIDKIALGPEAYEIFRKDPNQKGKDFAQLNFDQTPTVACMAILSQLQSEIARAESKALEVLATEVGASQIKFDKIVAFVSPEAQVVANGTKYKAVMFVAASSSTITPIMSTTVAPVKVEGGQGSFEFTANAQFTDTQFEVEKQFEASIRLQTPRGDTTIKTPMKYKVVKPVIDIQSTALSALYYNCYNEMSVKVPALGTAYDPSFQATGADVVRGSSKEVVALIPNSSGKVELKVSSGGNYIGSKTFSVKPIPLPEVKVIANGKEVDQKNGFGQFPRELEAVAIPNADFKATNPKDAQYRVTQWRVALVRSKRVVKENVYTGSKANLNDLGAMAKGGSGEILQVEIKEVQRMNYKGARENVNIGLVFYNLQLP